MKSNTQKYILVVTLLSLVLVTAIGCKSTANGAGKDIKKMGEKIEEKTR